MPSKVVSLHGVGVEAPSRVLVVTRKLDDALTIVAMLENQGLDLAVAESFTRAKSRMSRYPPAVLITDVRLGEFNGLHLVLRGKCSRPTMSALVIADAPDPVLHDEAERMGATFVVRPFSRRDLLAVLSRTISSTSGATVGASIRPPFERRRAERRVIKAPNALDRRRWDRRRGLTTLLMLAARTERQPD